MGVSVCLCKHPGVRAINNLFNIENNDKKLLPKGLNEFGNSS